MERISLRRGILLATALALLAAAFLISTPLALGQSETTPGAVNSVSLTRADGTLTVSWNAVSGATKYHALYQADGAGDWLPPIDDYKNITGTSFSFSIDKAKSYVVGVRAGNSAGWGPWTESPVSNPPLPAAVGTITLTRSGTTLSVSWPAVSGAKNYHALYQADGTGDWLPPIDEYKNITGTSFSFTIDKTKSYVVGVRGGNSGGWGPWTDSPASDPPLPAAVGTVSLSRDYDNGTLTVSWNAVDGAAKYHALYQADGAGDWLPPIDDYKNITGTGFRFDVDNTKSYVVGVRAGNSAGWGPWTESASSPRLETSEGNNGENPPEQTPEDDKPDSLSRVNYLEYGYNVDIYPNHAGTRWKKVENATGYHITARVDGQWKTVAKHATGTNWRGGTAWINLAQGEGCISLTKGERFLVDIRPIWWNGKGKWGEEGENFLAGPWRSASSHTIKAKDTEVCGVMLTASEVGVTRATLDIVNRESSWYYKSSINGKTDCTGVASGTSSVKVTGLKADTAYIFAAYSDSACQNMLDAAPMFTTLGFSYISNMNSVKNTNYVAPVNNTHKQAVVFTTGPNPSGYTLKEITIPMRDTDSGRADTLTLTLHAKGGSEEDISQPSETVLATLSGTAPVDSVWTDKTYTCSGDGCHLSHGTTYFVVGASSNAGDNAYEWALTSAEVETKRPSDNGWNIHQTHYKQKLAEIWGRYPEWNIAEIIFETNP